LRKAVKLKPESVDLKVLLVQAILLLEFDEKNVETVNADF